MKRHNKIKKESEIIKLLKKEEFTLEQISKICGVDIKKVIKIAKKIWKNKDKEKYKNINEILRIKHKFELELKNTIRKKYGFLR